MLRVNFSKLNFGPLFQQFVEIGRDENGQPLVDACYNEVRLPLLYESGEVSEWFNDGPFSIAMFDNRRILLGTVNCIGGILIVEG